MPYITFKHTQSGRTVLVEADVTYVPQQTLCRHVAASRDDLHYELELNDLGVYSEDGERDLTDQFNIPDSVFIRELELQLGEDMVDYTQVRELAIYEEAENYYDQD